MPNQQEKLLCSLNEQSMKTGMHTHTNRPCRRFSSAPTCEEQGKGEKKEKRYWFQITQNKINNCITYCIIQGSHLLIKKQIKNVTGQKGFLTCYYLFIISCKTSLEQCAGIMEGLLHGGMFGQAGPLSCRDFTGELLKTHKRYQEVYPELDVMQTSHSKNANVANGKTQTDANGC